MWKTSLSRRLRILGALLLLLCALALVQYRWINQLAEAQRQREKANLSASLSNLESDFDVEITRVFVAFQVPFASPNYSERYKQWLLHAPYPNLVRGVYFAEPGRTESVPKAAIPGEPAIRSTEWQRDLPELRSPLTGVAVSPSAPGSIAGLQTFSQGVMGGAFASRSPVVTVDGNPAFVVPIMPTEPGVATRLVTRSPGTELFSRGTGIVSVASPFGSLQWAVVVLDADYIRTTFLPRLVKLYFRNASTSDYDILVVNRNSVTSSRVVFTSESAPPEGQFAHADGSIKLFDVRLDCFSPPSFANTISVAGTPPNVRVLSGDSLSEILTRKPPTCSSPAPMPGHDQQGLWEMLVRYRAGSLDQAMATFRHRNLLLGGSVLLVLALGISMLVVSTERARALAEMQAEFVLGVSHELRTPLTVIRLAADNLKKGMAETSEQAHKYGEIIHAHASELSNMIEETLAFARMESTTLIPHRTPVAPEQIVKAALADNESALRDAGVEVELELAPDLPLLNVDLRLVRRCLENLIQNVVKYAATGRWMALRAKRVNGPDGERVKISVEDRGPGISPVDLPHVFEPFYRGKHGDASHAPGVGLGLTLVKRVVEAHHGTVEVENSALNGAIFSICLPSDRSQQETREAV
jgi:signal transduction histidine kinase